MKARGNYYAIAVSTQPNGKSYANTVARQARTFAAARTALDAASLPGYVQLWSDREQKRTVIAERDADGEWFTINPFRGDRVLLAKESAS